MTFAVDWELNNNYLFIYPGVRRKMTTRRTLTDLYNGDDNDMMLLGVRRRMITRRTLTCTTVMTMIGCSRGQEKNDHTKCTHLYNGDDNDRMLPESGEE